MSISGPTGNSPQNFSTISNLKQCNELRARFSADVTDDEAANFLHFFDAYSPQERDRPFTRMCCLLNDLSGLDTSRAQFIKTLGGIPKEQHKDFSKHMAQIAESLDVRPREIGTSLYNLEARLITILAKIPYLQREQACRDILSLLDGILYKWMLGTIVDRIASASDRLPAEELAPLLRHATTLSQGLEGETNDTRGDVIMYLSMLEGDTQRDEAAKFLMQCAVCLVSRWAALRTLANLPAKKRPVIMAHIREQWGQVSAAHQGWESLYSLIELLSHLAPEHLTQGLLTKVTRLQRNSTTREFVSFLLFMKCSKQINDEPFARFIHFSACLGETIPDVDGKKIEQIISSLSEICGPHQDDVVSRTLMYCSEISDSDTRFQFISDFIRLMHYLRIPAEIALAEHPKALYWLELLADLPVQERAPSLRNMQQCLTTPHWEDREAFVDYVMLMPKSQVATKVFWELIAQPLWDCIIPPYEALPLQTKKVQHYFYLFLQHNMSNDELPAILTALNQVPNELRHEVAGCATAYERAPEIASAAKRAATIAMIGAMYMKQNRPQQYHVE